MQKKPAYKHGQTPFAQLLGISAFALVLASCGGTSSNGVNSDNASNTITDNTADNATGDADAENNNGNPNVDQADNDNTNEDVVAVGGVSTLQVGGVVFSSLPEAAPTPDAASVELGRLLFWDPILSGDQDTACATCHLPEFGYADGRARSIGTGGVGTGPGRVAGPIGAVARNAQSVLNTVWNGINEFGVFNQDTAPMFWDARTTSLASQALEPIRAREEMRGDNFTEAQIDDVVVERLVSIAEYQALFQQAYGGNNPVTLQNTARALADFQSTLIANNSPYDQYLRGNTNALNNAQLNGMSEFAEHGCADCHSGPMFSDFDTHVLGVAEAQGLTETDIGSGNFAFRTPSLRQLAFTAPYFHGGQESSVVDAVDFYDNNNSDNPNVANNQLDPDFRDIPNLNNNEVNAIAQFLMTLNDADFDRSRPATVPSGLPVGGALQ